MNLKYVCILSAIYIINVNFVACKFDFSDLMNQAEVTDQGAGPAPGLTWKTCGILNFNSKKK